MRKLLALTVIISVALVDCKKESKPASEITGTWVLYSDIATNGSDTTSKMLASQYTCMSDNKMIFSGNGIYLAPHFAECDINTSLGHVTMYRTDDMNGSWSSNGSSFYVSFFDKNVNKTLIDTFVMAKVQGALYLAHKPQTGPNQVFTETFIKTQ